MSDIDITTGHSRSAAVGSCGEGIRSDCRITVWEGGGTTGEPRVRVRSKVAALYGDAIRRQITDLLDTLHAADLHVLVEDSGALPFTLAARLEAAVRRLPLSGQRGDPPHRGQPQRAAGRLCL